jgi:hypothetical protein
MKTLFFYILISGSVLAHQYNVNLMWINERQDPTQKYFCGLSKDEESYQKNCLKPMMDWMLHGSNTSFLRVWYDGHTTDKKLVDKALEDLKARFPPHEMQRFDNLVFADIRSLPDVIKNAEVFSERLPVYFRTDLLRPIIVDFLAKDFPDQYIVYADLNIPALTETQLFDKETLEQLSLFGFVLAKNTALDPNNAFENAFFIFDPSNKLILQAAKAALIDINIDRAKTFLMRGYTKKSEIDSLGGKALCSSVFPEVVYVSYNAMLAHYLYLNMALEFIWDDDLYQNISFLQSKVAGKDSTKSWQALIESANHSLFKNKFYEYSPFFVATSAVDISPKEREYLFTGGFAQVSYMKLLGEVNTPLLYLREIKKFNLTEARKHVDDEKLLRRSRGYQALYSVHKTIRWPFYRWEYQSLFHSNENTKLITIGPKNELGRFLMPIKEVNKPKSSFYLKNELRVLYDDDC